MDTSPVDSFERRRHRRTPLGIPVRLWVEEAPQPSTMEMIDVSVSGGAFRAPAGQPRLGQTAAFGFVMSSRGYCLAKGRIVRVSPAGFAVAFEETNPAFRGFVNDVSGPHEG